MAAPYPNVQQYPNAQYGNVLVKQMPGDWKHKLCGCMNNIPGCLAGAFCTPCYTCYLTCQMNETGLCCLSLFGNVLWPIRSYIRGKYDIPGSLCEDCLVTSCCPCCALCQLANEWQSRHSDVGVVFQQQTQVTTRVEERVHDTQPYYK